MSKAAYGILLVAILVWPPVYHLAFSRTAERSLGADSYMRDFEIQRLLYAQRWVVDIPVDKDGWYLSLETETDGKIETHDGASVIAGTQIVLLTRRDTEGKRIEYAWYQTLPKAQNVENGTSRGVSYSASGRGSVKDPLADASVTVQRPDGKINIGEPIYRGGRESVQGFPGKRSGDFEVRVTLTRPTAI